MVTSVRSGEMWATYALRQDRLHFRKFGGAPSNRWTREHKLIKLRARLWNVLSCEDVRHFSLIFK
jgi:hypothetical protein